MAKQTLGERVAELERELAELKAKPVGETHTHYHYPAQQQEFNYWPYYWTNQPYGTYSISGGNADTSGDLSV